MNMFAVWICFYIFSLPSCNGVKETIEEDMLPKSTQLPAFKLSVGNKGLLWERAGNSYIHTCGIGEAAEYWIKTKYVNISSTLAEAIHVDVDAQFTSCENPSNSAKVKCFSDYFEVYIHRGDVKPRLDSPSLTLDKVLAVFSPLYNITSNMTESIKNLTFSFHKNTSKGVMFAVRSRGACGKIFKMRMYHYVCEKKYVNSVELEKTLSPADGSKTVTVNCSENSLPSDNNTVLTAYCRSNGTWIMNKDVKCLCIKGYEPYGDKGCSRCSSVSFKQNVSNSMCIGCPKRSKSNHNRTRCECENGFYKDPLDEKTLSCYALLKLKEPLTITDNGKRSVTLTWSEPDKTDSLNARISYDVECFTCQQGGCNESCVGVILPKNGIDLTNTSVLILDLKPGTKYLFRVYPRNRLNKGLSKEKWNFLEIERFPFQPTNSTDPTSSSGFSGTIGNIIIAVVAVLLFALFVSLVIYACRRRGTRKNKKLQHGVNLPNVGLKPYVDPSYYASLEEAVMEFANELDVSFIYLERLIGGGEFGDVYKGELTTDGKTIPIAVKTLKHDASAKSSRDFLLEASVMAQFDNPNVVHMEGVVTKSKPRMIVLEYMSNGSLDNYLKSNDGILTRLQLLGMARGVAAGMNYLAEIKYVHRDLAARNVLVNDALLCKISDFGLSRELETANESSLGEYETTGGKIPIRWTAPEAIQYHKFSTASDVWSFGILLWEIMSFAQRPYWEWDNYKVMEEVDKGYRLPPPQKCPKGVHGLMRHCWNAKRSERPSFSQIAIVIDRWIRSPETMDDDVNFFITIGDWLASIKMGSYKAMFIEAGYKKQSEIIDLTDGDLKTIGVTLVGHRNKIIKGIETLRARKSRGSIPVME